MPPNKSLLNKPAVAILAVAVLVKRLGGSVTIVQADIDAMEKHDLHEAIIADGSLVFTVKEQTASH